MKTVNFMKLFTFFIFLASVSIKSQWIQKNFPSNEYLYIVRFASPDVGWAVGQNHVYKTTDSGVTWNINDTTHNVWKAFYVFDDSTVLYADVFSGITRTSDGGETWTKVDSSALYIDSFDFINSTFGFASGGLYDTATVYRTLDRGKSWEKISNTYISGGGADFAKVSFIDSLQGWAASYSGMIFHSTDGGFTWAFQDSTAKNYFAPLRDIQFTSADSGWAAGGIAGNSIMLRTTDGGTTWISSSVPVSFTNCSFREIYMYNSQIGWMVGSLNGGPEYIIKTTDGGLSWVDQTPDVITGGGIESISMLDQFHGFIVGGIDFDHGAIYETDNGGKATVVDESNNTVDKFYLSQNYPNPFNPATTIEYSLPKDKFVNLSIYNSLGQKAAVLINEIKKAGEYQINFDASRLASGVYFYRLESDNRVLVRKMLLLK